MKKYIIAFLFLTICLIIGCDKNPINGNLDGMWQLREIDTINGGTMNAIPQGIYYSFQLHLMEVKCTKGLYPRFLMRFTHSEDKLTITECYDPSDSKDSIITDCTQLNPYGINHLPEEFVVEKLNKEEMDITTDKLRLRFKKR